MVKWIVIIFLLCSYLVSAQDVIVKRSGEEIICNIDEVDDYYVHFYQIADVDRELLYKMDVALINKIIFSDLNMSSGKFEILKEGRESITDQEATGMNYIILNNIDGWINEYYAFSLRLKNSKYSFDISYKSYTSNDFFIDSHEGNSYELGVSTLLVSLGDNPSLYRGLYLRGHLTASEGSFFSQFSFGFDSQYQELAVGAQILAPFQMGNHWLIESYFGLAVSVNDDNIPSAQRADLSGGAGIMTTFGVRVGYMF